LGSNRHIGLVFENKGKSKYNLRIIKEVDLNIILNAYHFSLSLSFSFKRQEL